MDAPRLMLELAGDRGRSARGPDMGAPREMAVLAGSRGASVLEACAALALAAMLAGGLLSSIAPLSCALRVEAGRSVLLAALAQARREAYARESDVEVGMGVGSGEIVVRPPGSTRTLGERVKVVAGPADGAVGFRASGLADNATVRLACGAATASVVVNQRGVIR